MYLTLGQAAKQLEHHLLESPAAILSSALAIKTTKPIEFLRMLLEDRQDIIRNSSFGKGDTLGRHVIVVRETLSDLRRRSSLATFKPGKVGRGQAQVVRRRP